MGDINRAVRIAISGVHGSGKTTLCAKLVAHLRRNHINVNIVSECARKSLYLVGRRFIPELGIEIIGMQLADEMTASLMSDVVICDRSVLDTYVYTSCRFDCNVQGDIMLGCVDGIGGIYAKTYKKIFYIGVQCPVRADDVFRDTDPIDINDVERGFEETIRRWGLDVERVSYEDAFDVISAYITNGFKR